MDEVNPYILQVDGRVGKMLVKIGIDGTLEYGEGYDPDETARIFWEALALYAPEGIRLKPGDSLK